MLTTQFVFSGLLDLDWARSRDIATVGLGLDNTRSVFGATEGIPDDWHDGRLVLFVEQYRACGELRQSCGEECHCEIVDIGEDIRTAVWQSVARRLMVEDGMKWKEDQGGSDLVAPWLAAEKR